MRDLVLFPFRDLAPAQANEKKLSHLREAHCLLEESLKNDHKDEVAFTLAETKNKLAKVLLDSVKTSLLTNQPIVREAARLIASDGLTTSPAASFNHATSDGRSVNWRAKMTP